MVENKEIGFIIKNGATDDGQRSVVGLQIEGSPTILYASRKVPVLSETDIAHMKETLLRYHQDKILDATE